MSHNTRTVSEIKAFISKFSGIISQDFSQPKRRLIKEIIYGIQATQDIKLSNISRSLNEKNRLIKTEDRLSRNLSDLDFTEGINNQIARLGGKKIVDNTVIALDLGDIRKKYAKEMEYLCEVRDGSEKEIGQGYWLCKAVASDLEQKNVIPLYCEAYSQKANDFESENKQIYKCIDTISKHIGNKGIWAIDRGGDRNKIYDKLLKKGDEKRFVIRLNKRNLLHQGVAKDCYNLGKCLPCEYKANIIKYKDGKEEKKTIFYNALGVKLPRREAKLFLVVVKGFGKEPLMLLTNCEVRVKTKESIWRIVEIYLTRWKCEESYRYIKQSYNLEDLRVRSYKSIRNMVVLVLAVSYFAAVYLGQSLKLKILVERIFLVSKRFFGVPSFFNYAIADGIYNLLFPDKNGLTHIKENREKRARFQLCFDFMDDYF